MPDDRMKPTGVALSGGIRAIIDGRPGEALSKESIATIIANADSIRLVVNAVVRMADQLDGLAAVASDLGLDLPADTADDIATARDAILSARAKLF